MKFKIKVNDAIHSGSHSDVAAKICHEISKRFRIVQATCRKLFFIKRRRIIASSIDFLDFHAIIQIHLVYGLESLPPLAHHGKKLDVFHKYK